MKINAQTPKQSLNKAFLKQPVNRDDITLFKANLQILLGKINEKESEEHHKNFVRDFLKDTFYKSDYEINTKGRQDLVIHVGKLASDKVGVILEAKKPTNKGDMISADNPNRKALHELILYFLRERIDENNIDIKYLVITNINEWFVFDASVFNQLFYENKALVKDYKEWRDKQKTTVKTDLFYNEIAKPFIEKIESEVPCTYFDIRDYETALKNDDLKDDESLIELFKILSPQHLLKIPFADDSNKLDRNFYTELLHIIGLEEIKDKGKLKIQRKDETRRDAGSLIENAIAIIETKDCLYKVKNLESYGKDKDEKLFGVALELCLTWINRVLFLKLLEAQLVDYHNGNRDFRFLDVATIPDFDELFTLFHQVLAKLPEERQARIKAKYNRVPYLNSSLFEISELEADTITIESLKDTIELSFVNSSVLKDGRNNRAGLPTMAYLFAFLDAYDFASEGRAAIKEAKRSLINASVLGKVFEKINGYKDGSIYTPGFITMYMCRQAIRLAVVQKFKDAYGWNIAEFADIKNYLADRRSKADVLEFNQVINSLHLCDPAVGSGHFLVSSLNEIIAIKCELGILADADGGRFRDVEITIENDELTVFDTERGEFFKYRITNGKPTSQEAQRLQKTLFHEKQTLIENCLFGVDINPNSVKICRLRLWIELLKNAYYKEAGGYAELETLPNIDINIKEGNSLLSRFALNEDLKEVLKSKKNIVADYRNAVAGYKQERNRDKKRDLLKIIDEIKGDFTTEIYKHHPKMVDLAKKERRLYEVNSPSLFEKYSDGEREVLSRNLEKAIAELNKEIADIKSNVIYKNAFEWRFEFPEVLDDAGDFTGFDIVIGNPPYFGISTMEKDLQAALAKSNYQTFSKGSDIYCLFYEKGFEILKETAPINFITSNRFCFTNYGVDLRQYLSDRNILQIINFNDIDVFENANVGSLIMLLTKSQKDDSQVLSLDYKKDYVSKPLNDVIYEKSKILNKEFFAGKQWSFDDNENQRIKAKIESKGISFINWKDISINRGITTGLNEVFIISEAEREQIILQDPISEEIIKPVLKGANIKRFSILPAKEYLIYTYTNIDIKKYTGVFDYLNNYRKELEEVWEAKHGQKEWYELRKCSYYDKFFEPKLVWTRLSNRNAFAISESGEFTVDSSSFAVSEDIKYLSAILNSKVVFFYFKLGSVIWGKDGIKWFGSYFDNIPIPKIEEKDQQPFVVLVDRILELKKTGKDTLALENEIDRLVYRLYDLTAQEIAIVEGAKV